MDQPESFKLVVVSGHIDAVNLETKKALWSNRQRAPIASAMLAAGGIVFGGSRNRQFTAYDWATGKALWEAGLNVTPSSSPISFGAGGKQYVAVVSGGGGPLDASGSSLAPNLIIRRVGPHCEFSSCQTAVIQLDKDRFEGTCPLGHREFRHNKTLLC
jgi:hypothetical protein